MSTPATVIEVLVNGTTEPRSSCHQAEINVSREVSDTVVYWPREVVPAEGEWPVRLVVNYGKVYEGEGGDYKVTCSECEAPIDVEVEEN